MPTVALQDAIGKNFEQPPAIWTFRELLADFIASDLPVIATLSPGFPTYDAAIAGLKDGLRELGYVEGSTVKIEARWGLGKPETLPALAEELVRLQAPLPSSC
jgi:hypothetical protein